MAANSTKKGGPGKPFEKGKSGNPRGRPKMDPALKARLTKLTPMVVDFWEDQVTLKEREVITPAGPMTMTCYGKDAMPASVKLAEYAPDLGKPPQQIDLGASEDGPIGIAVEFVRAGGK